MNEKIAAVAINLGGAEPYHFICECATTACFESLALTLREYEDVRRNGSRFFVAPGHQDIELEHVVASFESYLVVEKDGPAGAIAEHTDPRS